MLALNQEDMSLAALCVGRFSELAKYMRGLELTDLSQLGNETLMARVANEDYLLMSVFIAKARERLKMVLGKGSKAHRRDIIFFPETQRLHLRGRVRGVDFDSLPRAQKYVRANKLAEFLSKLQHECGMRTVNELDLSNCILRNADLPHIIEAVKALGTDSCRTLYLCGTLIAAPDARALEAIVATPPVPTGSAIPHQQHQQRAAAAAASNEEDDLVKQPSTGAGIQQLISSWRWLLDNLDRIVVIDTQLSGFAGKDIFTVLPLRDLKKFIFLRPEFVFSTSWRPALKDRDDVAIAVTTVQEEHRRFYNLSVPPRVDMAYFGTALWARLSFLSLQRLHSSLLMSECLHLQITRFVWRHF